jgi:DNA-binding Xre family transcriptional regulator
MKAEKNFPSWIAINVKEKIIAQQIKIDTLAIALKLSKSAVSKMLNGQTQSLIQYLPKIAQILNCKTDDLLKQTDQDTYTAAQTVTNKAVKATSEVLKRTPQPKTGDVALQDKLIKQLEQNYVQAQAEITYWKTKNYRMKDRFTALEAKYSKKPSK